MTRCVTAGWPASQEQMDEGLLRVLAFLRMAFGLHMLYVVSDLGERTWFVGSLPESIFLPVGMAHFLPETIPATFVHIVFLLALVGSLLVAIGLFTSISSGLTVASVVIMGSLVHSFGKIDHGHHLLILLFLVLGSSPWGSRLSADSWIRRLRGLRPAVPSSLWPEWPLRVAMFVVALLYATAGALKIYVGGFLEPGTMSLYLAGRADRLEQLGRALVEPWGSISGFIISHPELGDLISKSTVLLELGILLGVLTRKLSVLVLGAVAILHASIMLLSGLVFVHNMIVALTLALAFLVLVARDKGGWVARMFPTNTRGGDPGGPKSHFVFLWTTLATLAALMAVVWLPLWGGSPGSEPWARPLLSGILPNLRTNAVHTVGLLVGLTFSGWALVSILLSVRRVAAASPQDVPPLVFLYDKDCGFCNAWINWAKRRRPHGVTFEPCQSQPTLLHRCDLQVGDCTDRSYLVPLVPAGMNSEPIDPAGGAKAILGVLRRFPGRRNLHWRFIGSMRTMTGVHAVLEWGYCLVAKNRHRLSRNATCSTTGSDRGPMARTDRHAQVQERNRVTR